MPVVHCQCAPRLISLIFISVATIKHEWGLGFWGINKSARENYCASVACLDGSYLREYSNEDRTKGEETVYIVHD